METERTADDVSGLLADERRLDVLPTVAEVEHENRTTGVAGPSFSDIYDRVDTAPDEYRVALRRDAATLRLSLDGNAAVTRTERVRRRDQRRPPIGVETYA